MKVVINMNCELNPNREDTSKEAHDIYSSSNSKGWYFLAFLLGLAREAPLAGLPVVSVRMISP